MSFSVDYQFTSAGPSASRPYVWVIEPSRGPAARQQVRLRAEGNLKAFVQQFRPEQKPFRCHIEDPDGNRISPSASMR